MPRRTMEENRQLARDSAWRQLGRQHYGWFVGWEIAGRIALPLLAAAAVLFVGWQFWRAVSGGLPDLSAPDAPASSAVWPYVLIAISAAGIPAILAYRWWNPGRRNVGSLVAAGALFCVCVALALWVRG